MMRLPSWNSASGPPDTTSTERPIGDRPPPGLITVGVERLGYRLSLSHIAEGEWRAQFSQHPMWASVGFGMAETPWRAVQLRAAGAFVARLDRLDDRTRTRASA
jgi:hypothetical protein